jgi:NAD(P)-dependent dehydrogenase (short-subunit alcohol dehydrogenase family)
MDLELRGKRAIVTGGSRGIGKAVARELALEGARVVIAARNRSSLDDVAAELMTEGATEIHAIQCDTGLDDQVRDMVTGATALLGGVDILINCAGRPGNLEPAPKIADITDDVFFPDLNVKLMGYLRCIREVAPIMAAGGGGRIVNVSGISARHTGSTVHSMRNVAIVAMTKNLADELGPSGISVIVIHPAYCRTEATPTAIAARAALDGVSEAEIERRLESEIALGRIMDAREIAWVIAFLASVRAISINGDLVVATGGMLGPIYY